MPTDSGIQLPEKSNRLDRLIEIACDYRGWSRAELAKALGRSARNIAPPSGNPKMDYVSRLAGVLDWEVSDLAAILFEDGKFDDCLDPDFPSESDTITSMNYKEADDASRQAWEDGEYKRSVRFARQAVKAAKSAEQRANGHLGEALAWETLGRYTRSLDALRRALSESPISPLLNRKLQGNLSNIYYSLWHLSEARALSGELIHYFSNNQPDNMYDRSTSAFANYIYGHVLRRSIGSNEVEVDQELAEKAIMHLKLSIESYEMLKDECEDPTIEEIQNTCKYGLVELEVLSGDRSPESAIESIKTELDALIDVSTFEPSHALESFGWMCIFGCNIALRSLTGSEQQQAMAILTNKGDEIADRLDNWAIRERVVTLEYARRLRLSTMSGVKVDWLLHPDEVRAISGTMGRFPSFRPIGWTILEEANVIRGRN